MTSTERTRRWRKRKRDAKRDADLVGHVVPDDPAEAVQALARWARETLVVPDGHPLAGQPMALPKYAVSFLEDGWDAHESALSIARKNGKSAVCAILALGHLVGPLRTPGWRGCVVSVTKEKASELRNQVVEIAEASGIQGLTIRRSPYPGAVTSATGKLECLSADRTAGHASGFNLCIVDETGLFPVRKRELLDGLASSVSARRGRLIHISIRGDGELYREILENSDTVAHIHAADTDCDISDETQWAKANPELGRIKSRRYMAAKVSKILAGSAASEPAFRSHDLNLPLSPDAELILSPADLDGIFTDAPPPREGPAYLGCDFGEATSASAAFAIWPQTGRCEAYIAFGDDPPLAKRARVDDAPYQAMLDRGELLLYSGPVTPVPLFLADVAERLAGCEIAGVASDPYKRREAQHWLSRAGLHWQYSNAEGVRRHSADVRALTRMVKSRQLSMAPSMAFSSAVAKSQMSRDIAGNPKLSKRLARGRIDCLSAALIAAGLAEPWFGWTPRAFEPIYV